MGPLYIIHYQPDAVGFEVGGGKAFFFEAAEQGGDEFIVDPWLQGWLGAGQRMELIALHYLREYIAIVGHFLSLFKSPKVRKFFSWPRRVNG